MKKRFHLIQRALLFLCAVTGFASADSIIPLPESRETFVYSATVSPSVANAISKSKQVGIGYLTEGGDTFNLHVSIGSFVGPVDMYITMLSPDEKRGPVFALRPDNTFEPFWDSMKAWRTNVTEADEFIMDIATSSMVQGPYVLMFTVMPVDVQDRYYLWTVPFLVP